MSTTMSTLSKIGDTISKYTPYIEFAGQTVKAFGQFGEAQVGAQAQEFAAGSELFNADVARQEGRLAQIKARFNIARHRKGIKALIGRQEALVAKSGVTFEGSPLLVMEDSLASSEFDILIEKFNADVFQQRGESEAQQRELKATQRRTAAGQIRRAGRLRAGMTLLTAGTDLLSKIPKK